MRQSHPTVPLLQDFGLQCAVSSAPVDILSGSVEWFDFSLGVEAQLDQARVTAANPLLSGSLTVSSG